MSLIVKKIIASLGVSVFMLALVGCSSVANSPAAVAPAPIVEEIPAQESPAMQPNSPPQVIENNDGHNDTEPQVSQALNIQNFWREDIGSFSAGGESVAATLWGDIVVWNSPQGSGLSRNREISHPVVAVSNGYRHTLLLTADGQLLAMGNR